MNLKIINPLEYPDWDALLLSNEKATFFHTTNWARVLSESYCYKPLYFTSIKSGKLETLIPIMEVKSFLTGGRGVSLPFTDICEPVTVPNFNKNEVWAQVVGYGEKAGWLYLELRGGDCFGQCQHPTSCYYEHVLDLLKGTAGIYSHLSDSNKRNIKKAEKANLEVAIDPTLEGMRDFYRLNCLTRRMHGLPPQPFSFFKKIQEHIINKRHGVLIIARNQGRAIAANVYFHFGNQAIYKYGASEKKYHHLRPNNLVMWHAIKWYCENGFSSLSFGRTDPAHDGLRHFKTGWGPEERRINYFRYNLREKIFTRHRSSVDGWYSSIFRRMPIPLLRVVGTILYEHMG